MGKSNPSSITVEEAVARMVNMDYIPAGFTLQDMMSAFQEEAELAYKIARRDHAPEQELLVLENRMNICTARQEQARWLEEDLKAAVQRGESSLAFADESSSKPRLLLESVAAWAAETYGIGIPEWTALVGDDVKAPPNVRWEDVEIRIYENHTIACAYKPGKFQVHKTFQEIGLMGRRKNEPNQLGGILIGLSEGHRYPPLGAALPPASSAISKLGSSLKRWTGLTGEPFRKFNKHDGWKPRFKLKDARNAADERAKRAAQFTSYDDNIGDTSDKWSE